MLAYAYSELALVCWNLWNWYDVWPEKLQKLQIDFNLSYAVANFMEQWNQFVISSLGWY